MMNVVEQTLDSCLRRNDVRVWHYYATLTIAGSGRDKPAIEILQDAQGFI